MQNPKELAFNKGKISIFHLWHANGIRELKKQRNQKINGSIHATVEVT